VHGSGALTRWLLENELVDGVHPNLAAAAALAASDEHGATALIEIALG
jgi:hypothetical protein